MTDPPQTLWATLRGHRPFASVWWSTGLARSADEVFDYLLLALSATALLGVLRPGLLGLAITLPGALFAIFAGVAVDRLGARRATVLRLCDAGRAVTLGCFVLLPVTATGAWAMVAYLALFVTNTIGVLRHTCVMAALPDLFDGPGDPRLRRGNALLGSQEAAVSAVAPLVGTALLAVATARVGFSLAGVLFALAVAAVLPAVRTLQATPAPGEHAAVAGGGDPAGEASAAPGRRRGFLAQTAEGVRVLFADRLLRVPLLVNATSNVFIWGLVFALPLVVADRDLGAGALGVALSLMVVASIAGSLAAGRWSRDRALIGYLVAEPVLQAAGYVVLAVSGGAVGLFGAILLVNLPQGFGLVARRTFLQVRFPSSLRGRVFGQFMALNRVLLPGAPLLMQLFADTGRLEGFFLLGALVCALLAVALVANPLIREGVRAGVDAG